MPRARSDGERLATIEQVLRDLREDVEAVQLEHREDHHRLRAVEGAVTQLVEHAKQAQRLQDLHLRTLGIRIQWLAAAIAFGGLALGLALALTNR